MNVSIKIIIIFFNIAFLGLNITGCGGGENGNRPPSNDPPGIAIETLPGKELIEPALTMKAPPGEYLYYGTNYAIVEVSKSTGNKRTLIGNLLHQTVSGETGYIRYPRAPSYNNGYMYTADSNGKVFRLNATTDNFTSVEITIPNKSLIGCCNFDGITGNSTHLFYYKSNGTTSTSIYKKAFSSLTGPEFVVTIPGTITVVASETHLYITNAEVSEKNLYKYNLSTGDLSILQANLSSIYYVQPPIAKFGTNIYWVNGLSIYKINENNNNAPQLVASNIGSDIRYISADDQFIYVRDPNSSTNILKVSINNGAVESITTPTFVNSIAVLNGQLYWLSLQSGLHLYTLDLNDQPVEIIITEFSELGQLGGTDQIKISSGDNKIILTTGRKLLIYDPATSTSKVLYTATRAHYFHSEGKYLYIAHSLGDPGISKITLDKEIRTEERLDQSNVIAEVNYIQSFAIEENYIYWLWRSHPGGGLPPNYYISRSMLDGTMYEELFQSNSELRDISVHAGEIFFSCLDNCAAPGWVLASIPLAGGQPTAVYALLNDPSVYYKNGIFYVVDTDNIIDKSLFVINVDLNDSIEILSGLYPDHVFVEVSDKWIYVADIDNTLLTARLSRYEFIDWDTIGNSNVIVNGSGDAVYLFSINTITSDGSHLYYYHNGLKRVAE